MTTSNEHNNAPAVLEQELSALLTTSLPYMTPVGRARLGQDIAQLYSSVSAPAVPQGEPVAWMVYGNYTRQPFGMLSSAEAYMRGLLKSDPDGGYHIRPLTYATPVPSPAPAPAPAQEFNKSVADAEIKAMYVESQGSDKGWLGIEGSYFIGGVVAARKQKAAPAPAQEPLRPQNCGTSYCSCIECVCEPAQEVGLTDETQAQDERRSTHLAASGGAHVG